MSRHRRRHRSRANSPARTAPAAYGYTPFDGANPSPSRPFLPMVNLDSRREVDVFARTELVKASRFCFNNSPEFQRLFKGLAHYAIGSGLFAVPETSDEEWNVLNMMRHERWAGNRRLCDVHRRRSWYQMQRHMLLNMMLNGAQFAAKVHTLAGGALQMIDAMDVGCAGAPDEKDGRVWDGVHIDDSDGAVAYRVLGRKPGEYTDVAASDMLHIYDPQRTLQFRELPWAYTGTNSGRDIIDIIAATKNGVKLDSLFGLVVKQETPAQLGTHTRPGGGGGPSQNNAQPQAKDERLEQFSRSGILAYLRPGESIETINSNRGNAEWRNFIKFLIGQVAWSLGVSPDFLFFIVDSGGVSARAGMEDMAWFVLFLQDLLIETACSEVYVWNTAVDLAAGRIRKCKDPEWWKHGHTRPARVTADQGKTAQADIALRNAGMLSLDTYAGRVYGGGYRTLIDQLIREERYLQLQCMANKVDPNRIRPPAAGSVVVPSTPEQTPQPEEDK